MPRRERSRSWCQLVKRDSIRPRKSLRKSLMNDLKHCSTLSWDNILSMNLASWKSSIWHKLSKIVQLCQSVVRPPESWLNSRKKNQTRRWRSKRSKQIAWTSTSLRKSAKSFQRCYLPTISWCSKGISARSINQTARCATTCSSWPTLRKDQTEAIRVVAFSAWRSPLLTSMVIASLVSYLLQIKPTTKLEVAIKELR